MRETKRSNDLLHSQTLNIKQEDVLRQAVEQEYTALYRQVRQAAHNVAQDILRDVPQPPRPRSLTIPIPASTIVETSENEQTDQNVSVLVADGANKNSEKNSTIPTLMPTLPIVRELVSYVPTTRNVASRGDLIGIPYLGDQFDAEDQRLINSISIAPSKQHKSIRKKKLDESSLETLFQSLRSNHIYQIYSNEQILNAILHFHRDDTPRTRLVAFAHQITNCSLIDKEQRAKSNIDKHDSVDMDINELLIKPWCARFCPRCYAYNCLLHKEGPSYLPVPKQIPISMTNQSEACSTTCYKHQRESLKRSLSPCDSNERKKRARKSSNSIISNENLNCHSLEPSKRHTSHCLTRIENHMSSPSMVEENWSEHVLTPTDRSLFRLFYFLLDGDLCLLTHLFPHRTCQDLYAQLITDSKYFSEHTLITNKSSFLIRQPYRRRMPDGSTRTFLNYMKKNLNRTQSVNKWKNTTTTLKPAYQPCGHDGPCTPENDQCCCIKMGTFCEKFCSCAVDCPRRFPGCACKGSCLFNNCLCAAEGRECDPDLCHNCGASVLSDQFNSSSIKLETPSMMVTQDDKTLASASMRNVRSRTTGNLPTRSHTLRSCRTVEPSYKITSSQGRRTHSRASLTLNTPQSSPTITCANISLQRKIHKQILVAESDIAGYGAFLGSPIAQPGDLIAEYTGEIISEEEADRRGRLYDKRACSYLFNLDMQHCIDARQFGNKLRFANHSAKANCVPKIKLVNGDHRIGIYAKEVIFQGDELLFEYMYDAHQRQQFTNNERIDEAEQENYTILRRYADNFMLVQPSYD